MPAVGRLPGRVLAPVLVVVLATAAVVATAGTAAGEQGPSSDPSETDRRAAEARAKAIRIMNGPVFEALVEAELATADQQAEVQQRLSTGLGQLYQALAEVVELATDTPDPSASPGSVKSALPPSLRERLDRLPADATAEAGRRRERLAEQLPDIAAAVEAAKALTADQAGDSPGVEPTLARLQGSLAKLQGMLDRAGLAVVTLANASAESLDAVEERYRQARERLEGSALTDADAALELAAAADQASSEVRSVTDRLDPLASMVGQDPEFESQRIRMGFLADHLADAANVWRDAATALDEADAAGLSGEHRELIVAKAVANTEIDQRRSELERAEAARARLPDDPGLREMTDNLITNLAHWRDRRAELAERLRRLHRRRATPAPAAPTGDKSGDESGHEQAQESSRGTLDQAPEKPEEPGTDGTATASLDDRDLGLPLKRSAPRRQSLQVSAAAWPSRGRSRRPSPDQRTPRAGCPCRAASRWTSPTRPTPT